MDSVNPELVFMAAKLSVLGPTLSYPQYLRSAQGRFFLNGYWVPGTVSLVPVRFAVCQKVFPGSQEVFPG